MCFVAFQNIFRKIFSGVWKRSWKRRRKKQNPEKPKQTQKNTTWSRDRRRDLAKCRSRSARTVLCEIAPSDCDRPRVLSLSCSPFARALFARPQFRKSFEVKIGMEMNFRGQRYYFTVNWKWFPENSIFQSNQTAYFTENDFLKLFSSKTNTA